MPDAYLEHTNVNTAFFFGRERKTLRGLQLAFPTTLNRALETPLNLETSFQRKQKKRVYFVRTNVSTFGASHCDNVTKVINRDCVTCFVNYLRMVLFSLFIIVTFVEELNVLVGWVKVGEIQL